ncbi:hypothetical protein JTE90_012343 [Oedothorax gibbosus]|uniref:Uncharacterized protein n=1 Tax=Oedothorax gibbosus TaxID=931172 RepID=A0AAV6V7J9_9ARAC|nr:hypothetical protein JTE90_012343 [Oedothorax gibbosus]
MGPRDNPSDRDDKFLQELPPKNSSASESSAHHTPGALQQTIMYHTRGDKTAIAPGERSAKRPPGGSMTNSSEGHTRVLGVFACLGDVFLAK